MENSCEKDDSSNDQQGHLSYPPFEKLGENLGLILLMSSRFMAVGQIILI